MAATSLALADASEFLWRHPHATLDTDDPIELLRAVVGSGYSPEDFENLNCDFDDLNTEKTKIEEARDELQKALDVARTERAALRVNNEALQVACAELIKIVQRLREVTTVRQLRKVQTDGGQIIADIDPRIIEQLDL